MIEVRVYEDAPLNVDTNTAVFVGNHNDLTGRDAANQHPISAITNLEATLLHPVTKTAEMTQAVGRDSDGKLYTEPATAVEWGNITGDIEDQTDLQEALDAKQDKIDAQHKLSSDLVDDTNHTNKFVTAQDKLSWNAKYDKPASGIPSTDMASSVQASLSKADTSVQQVSNTNKVYGTDSQGNQTTYDKNSFGQVDDVKINGTSVVTNKIAQIVYNTAISADSANAPTTTAVKNFVNAHTVATFVDWS